MKRIMIVHFSGDFREAYRRRVLDGSESYYGHGYVLDQLDSFAKAHGAAAYMCCLAPEYREEVMPGVTLMGGGANPIYHPHRILDAIAKWRPTHVVVHGPMMRLLAGVMKMDVQLACLWADSFAIPGWRRQLRFGNLAKILNSPKIDFVANHGLNASQGLASLGVAESRIVAWDFPHPTKPTLVLPRKFPNTPIHDLLYVGSIERKKGVVEAVQAMTHLRDSPVRLIIVGSGRARASLEKTVRRKGLTERVIFKGSLPNSEIRKLMRAVTAVLIPSRHAFPEGLPLTLFEAVASRTPVVTSDHPMFKNHAVDRKTAMVFPEKNARALARAIKDLISDPALFEAISQAAPQAWESMQVPVRWGELIDKWAAGGGAWSGWLQQNSLASLKARGG